MTQNLQKLTSIRSGRESDSTTTRCNTILSSARPGILRPKGVVLTLEEGRSPVRSWCTCGAHRKTQHLYRLVAEPERTPDSRFECRFLCPWRIMDCRCKMACTRAAGVPSVWGPRSSPVVFQCLLSVPCHGSPALSPAHLLCRTHSAKTSRRSYFCLGCWRPRRTHPLEANSLCSLGWLPCPSSHHTFDRAELPTSMSYRWRSGMTEPARAHCTLMRAFGKLVRGSAAYKSQLSNHKCQNPKLVAHDYIFTNSSHKSKSACPDYFGARKTSSWSQPVSGILTTRAAGDDTFPNMLSKKSSST